MKKLYDKIIVSDVNRTLLKGFLAFFILIFLSNFSLQAQTVTGDNVCEGGSLTVGVDNPTAFNWYVLFRLDTDGDYTKLQALSSGDGSSFTFSPSQTLSGKYEVYEYVNSGDIPTGQSPNSGDYLLGNKWIYTDPDVKTLEITGTYTINGSGEYVICDGYGQVQIQNTEAIPAYYNADWDVSYQLYKNGVAEGTPKTSSTATTHVWQNLDIGTYTVKAYRGLSTCETDMTGSILMEEGFISNTTQTICYQTIQAAIDGASSGDNISIPTGSYDEALTVSENVTFSSTGLVIQQSVTINSGITLTLASDLTIDGSLIYGDATAKIDLSGHTLIANGDVVGDGFFAINSTSNLELYGEVATTSLNFDGTQINNLTIEFAGADETTPNTLALEGDLTVYGDLNLVGDFDELALNEKTLTLQGDLPGFGSLIGDASATLIIDGTGDLYLTVFDMLSALTINRDAEITLETFDIGLAVGTFAHAEGTLVLNSQSLSIDSYTRTNGIFAGDDLASLTFGSASTGTLVFDEGANELGSLVLETSETITLGSAMTVYSAQIYSGTLETTEAVTFATTIENGGILTLGADAQVDGLFASSEATSVFNVGANTFTFGGDITIIPGGVINAGATSSLVFNGTSAFELPSNITELNNLTINRTDGVSMTGDLDVKNLLTLTSGNFNIGDGFTLTLNKAMSGTIANLKSVSTSNLVVKGSSAVSLPALGLATLDIDNSATTTLTGAVAIFDELFLQQGTLSNGTFLTINDGKTINRSGGALTAEPNVTSTLNVEYTGVDAITTGFEIPVVNITAANITVNNGAGVTLGSSSTINNITLTNGNFDFSGKVLTMTGDLTPTSGSLLADVDAQLILNGTNAFTIPASITTLGNLNINRTGGVTMGGDLLVDQSLTLDEAFTVGANRLTIKNNITGGANLTAGGTSLITIAGDMAGVNLPSHITNLSEFNLNNVEGTTLQNDLTVTTLNLDAGAITLGTFDLSAATIDGGSATAFVVANAALADYGKLIVPATTNELLPIGYSVSAYTPVTITNGTAADVSAAVKYITLMSDFEGPVPSPNYVKLEYQLTNSAPDNASVTFVWNEAEDFGSAPTTPVVGHYVSNEWQPAGTTGTLTPGTTTITATGITGFSSFAIYGDKLDVVYVDASIGNDDNTGETATAGPAGPKATIGAALQVVADDGSGKLIIADATAYDEDVNLGFDIEFETSGVFTLNQMLTLDGAVLAMNGDMTVVGTTTLTASSDKITVGDNTLSLGDWTGDGFLTITSTSNLVLNGEGVVLNFDGTQINNLTIEFAGADETTPNTLALEGDLTVYGDLNLVGDFDELALNEKTLTLQGDLPGFGSLIGDASATLIIDGTGDLYLTVFDMLSALTINRDAEITLETFDIGLAVGTFTHAEGTLVLNSQSLSIDSYTRTNGIFAGDDLASLTFGSASTGTLVFDEGANELGSLVLETSETITLGSAMTVYSAQIYSGTLETTEAVTFATTIENGGILTLGADAQVDGLFASSEATSVFNVGPNTFTFGGDITIIPGGVINAGATSSLVFNGTSAFELPSNITELNNLTINRTDGVSMTGDLDVKNLLTLTSGNFNIGDGFTLTLNKAMSGTIANLKSVSTSNLVVKGSSAVSLPALGLATLDIDNSATTTLTGAVAIFDELFLQQGTLSNGTFLTINDGKTINRSGGALTAEPNVTTTLNVEYTGVDAITTGFEIPVVNITAANITVNNGAGVTLGSSSTINNITLTNGNFDFSGKVLTMTGDLTPTSGSLLADVDAQLILNGTNAFTIPASITTLGNLNINRTGGVTMGGDLLVDQSLTLDEAFTVGANRLTIKNNITGGANLTAGGTSLITIAGDMAGVNLPSHITNLSEFNLNNVEGTTLQNDLTVTTLNLDAGAITLGTFDLSAATIDGGSATAFVVANAALADYGKLIVPATTNELLPIGYSVSAYTPVTITNGTAADVSAAVKYITLMSDFEGPVPSPNYVKLEYQLTNSAPDNASVTFVWNEAEDFGSAPTTPVVGHYVSNEWQPAGTTGTLTPGTTTITATGITGFSSFAIYGDKLDVVYVDASIGNDDNTGETATAGPAGPKATIGAALQVVADDGSGKLIIADATAYDEDVNLGFDIEFETSGVFTLNQMLTLDGAVLAMNGDMTVAGTTTLTASSDKITVGDNTLTLNGDWDGDGYLTVASTSNLVLNNAGIVTNFNLDGTALNNLTLAGGIDGADNYHGVTLLSDLTIHGTLLLTDEYDELILNSNKLTLLGVVDDLGIGVLIGDEFAELDVSGSGGSTTVYFVGGTLDVLTIDRTGETVGIVDVLGDPLTINTLALTAGTLDLSDQFLTINTAYTGGGDFEVNSLTEFTFEGSTTGALEFSAASTELGALTLNTSGQISVEDALTIYNAYVSIGATLVNNAAVTFETISNLGSITLGADASVTGLFASDDNAAVLNVGAHTFTFGGNITFTDDTYINAGATSSLVFNGTSAFDLPSNITELNNLTINRTDGVKMTNDLDIAGLLTLTSGDFSIYNEIETVPLEATLSINDMEITGGNLVGESISSLIVNGTTAIDLPGITLHTLQVNNEVGVNLTGNLGIFNTLDLQKGQVDNSLFGINFSTPGTGYTTHTIIRNAGSMTDAPLLWGAKLALQYTGAGSYTTLPEFPLGSSVETNVTMTGNGALTLDGDRTVNNLILTDGTFNIDANTLTLNSNLTGTTLTGGLTSSLILNGTDAFLMPTGITALNNLTVNRAGGASLQADLELDNVLTLTSGNFNLGDYGLTLKNAIAGVTTNLKTTTASSLTILGDEFDFITIPTSVENLKALTLNNPNGTALIGNLTIAQSLTLTNGILAIDAFDLTVPSAGISIDAGESDSYIIANSTDAGVLTVTGVSSSVLIPVGYSFEALQAYTPLTLSNDVATSFTIGIKRINDPTDFIYTVTSPEYVALQWYITRSVAGTGSVTFNWNAGEAYGYAPTYVGYTPDDETDWTAAGSISGGATTTSVTVTGITDFGYFAAYKATPTIVWNDPDDITYGTALGATQLNATAIDPTSGATVAGTFTYNPAAGAELDAGTHDLTASFIPTSNGYLTPTDKIVSINVLAKNLAVNPIAGQSKTYGDTDPVPFTYEASGFGFDDGYGVFSGSLTRVTGESVGNYEILIGSLSAGTNYNIVYTPDDFAITQLAVTVTADAGQSKEYGQIDPAFTYTTSPTGTLANGEVISFTGALARTAGETVEGSPYAINQGDLDNSNYDITFVADNFAITQLAVTVTTDADQSKEYGQLDPTFTYVSNPAVNFELPNGELISFTGALARTAGETVEGSPYAINQGDLDNSNYDITFVADNFAITQLAVTVTADADQSKEYGQLDPTFTYVSNPAVNFELPNGELISFTGALARTAGETVEGSPYAINQGDLDNSNYDITFVADNFAITQLAVTVTADADQSKEYGQLDPTFTYVSNPAVNFELPNGELISFTGALARTAGETVEGSPYAINQGDLDNSNYDITFVADNFAITQLAVTVTADADQSKEYGQLDPTFTYVSNPAVNFELPNGELISFTGALARTAGETVEGSPYAINQGDLDNSNYDITFVADNFTITPKPLTITGSFTAYNKIYDGSTDATINTNSLTFSGIVGTDVVNLTAVAAFADATVGNDKTVSLTNASSIDNANYSIDPVGQTPAAPTTTANILSADNPVITNVDGSAASTTANEGDQVAYKVVDRGAGFSYAWSFVEAGTTNVILVASGNQVEVEWNENGTLQVTESYNNGSGGATSDLTGTLAVTVTTIPFKGTVMYNRNDGNHSPLDGITVKLIPDGGGTTLVEQTDATGYYEFETVADGDYTLEISNNMIWGGGNSTDALAIQRRSIGNYPSFYTPANFDFVFRDKVGDVNANDWVNATDALLVKRRAIQLVNSFTAGDWAFYIPTSDQYFTNTNASTATLSYTHDSNNPTEFNILAMAYGDVNASYTVTSKSLDPVQGDNVRDIAVGEQIELPVQLNNPDNVGAITLYLKFNEQLIDVKGVESDVANLIYNIKDGYVNIAWSDPNSLTMSSENELFRMVVEAKTEISPMDDLFYIDSRSEFADVEAIVLDDVDIRIDRLNTGYTGVGSVDVDETYNLTVYPNPALVQTNVRYTLPKDGNVQLRLYNAMGMEVAILDDPSHLAGEHNMLINANELWLTSGVYYIHITISCDDSSYDKVVPIVFKD